MIRKWALALALLLPLLGLAAGILRNELNLRAGTTWVIPVAGYDPRDPLRGRYVTFRYLWEVEGDAGLCGRAACDICLEQRTDLVVAHIVPRGAPTSCPNRVDPDASGMSGFASRIFVSEISAPALEAALRRGPLDVVAVLGRDGRLINRRLQPRGRIPDK